MAFLLCSVGDTQVSQLMPYPTCLCFAHLVTWSCGKCLWVWVCHAVALLVSVGNSGRVKIHVTPMAAGFSGTWIY